MHDFDTLKYFSFIKDCTIPSDSFDDILHKVMATCSRVEQRLSEKRKVRKSGLSSSPKYSDSKGITYLTSHVSTRAA